MFIKPYTFSSEKRSAQAHETMPMRPIIPCSYSVASNLSRRLAKQLSPLLGTIDKKLV